MLLLLLLLICDHFNDRQDLQGEVADQAIHFPFAVPKLTPGRLYVKFGKPIITAGVCVFLDILDGVDVLTVISDDF